jgi:hypothetical protein
VRLRRLAAARDLSEEERAWRVILKNGAVSEKIMRAIADLLGAMTSTQTRAHKP